MAGRTQGTPHIAGWLAFLGAVLVLIWPSAAESAYPGANGRIAFTVEVCQPPPPPDPIPPEYPHPGLPIEPVLVSSRMVSVLPNGSRKRRLHNIPVGGGAYYGAPEPAFSPNGRLIAFHERGRLAIMRHDGSGLRTLPPLSTSDFAPTWSPNGRRFAFFGQRPCPLYCGTLYTVRIDGSGLRQVTDYEAQWPAWSVRGRIAFLNNDDQYRFMVGPRDGLYSIRAERIEVASAVRELRRARQRAGLVARRPPACLQGSPAHRHDERRRQQPASDHEKGSQLRPPGVVA
jgi:WD40-like Beta Propeller Repeat